jgi:hypothetical protein
MYILLRELYGIGGGNMDTYPSSNWLVSYVVWWVVGCWVDAYSGNDTAFSHITIIYECAETAISI